MQYKTAFDAYLEERKSPYLSIVAFSGSHEYAGKKDVTEATMNCSLHQQIPSEMAKQQLRFSQYELRLQDHTDAAQHKVRNTEEFQLTAFCQKQFWNFRSIEPHREEVDSTMTRITHDTWL